jgi:hypothetical protein
MSLNFEGKLSFTHRQQDNFLADLAIWGQLDESFGAAFTHRKCNLYKMLLLSLRVMRTHPLLAKKPAMDAGGKLTYLFASHEETSN